MRTLVQETGVHVEGGGLPFGAAIVTPDGHILAIGYNRVSRDHDPTAHAEIMAIRTACRQLRRTALDDHLLLATGEPCGLCAAAARCSGIAGIYYALDRDEVAAYGFDYRESYRSIPKQLDRAGIRVHRLEPTDRHAPFEAFSSRHAGGW